MAEPRCPICRQPSLASRAESWFPFCSERCKLIDLGKWLSDGYRVPSEEDEPGQLSESEDEGALH